MNYTLRLFEDQTEVITATVGHVSGAYNYPSLGQTIDGIWLIVGHVSHSEKELRLRVERVS